MPILTEYGAIVGKGVIDELRMLSSHLKNVSVQNINSTAVGGGVAEILHRMIPLLKSLGVNATWDVIRGGEQFFSVTKKIHNALHGNGEELTQKMIDIFWETSRLNLEQMNCDADIVFVHDPQPIALIEQKKKYGNKWIWRCHVDVSHPQEQTWKFLHDFVTQYDASVFSAPQFSQRLPIPQAMIMPSIDPLSDKNRDLSEEEIQNALKHFGITSEKPIVTQISRFDYLKDPVGVIQAYKLVKQHVDCQLVLGGGTASDDPESDEVLVKVREAAGNDPDIHVLLIPPESDVEINALQRASAVVVQKSIKEGFGLTVTEALWKGKPVVAGAVGGIPLQIIHRHSGMLCHSIEGCALAIKQLLNNPDFASQLGANGREHVRSRFLLTRHLKDYLLLFLSLDHKGDIIEL